MAKDEQRPVIPSSEDKMRWTPRYLDDVDQFAVVGSFVGLVGMYTE
jgi:hypothetical protein